jgi:hypothetical protein
MYNASIQPSDPSIGSFDPTVLGYDSPCEVDGDEYEEHTNNITALEHEDIRHLHEKGYEAYNPQGEEHTENSETIYHTHSRSRAHQYRPYPITDHIRHLYTLHSLLPHIDPWRKLQAFHGPVIHVVEQDTRAILAHSIQKRLLVLFLGH